MVKVKQVVMEKSFDTWYFPIYLLCLTDIVYRYSIHFRSRYKMHWVTAHWLQVAFWKQTQFRSFKVVSSYIIIFLLHVCSVFLIAYQWLCPV